MQGGHQLFGPCHVGDCGLLSEDSAKLRECLVTDETPVHLVCLKPRAPVEEVLEDVTAVGVGTKKSGNRDVIGSCHVVCCLKERKCTYSSQKYTFNFPKIEAVSCRGNVLLYSSKMEGACGHILATENPQVVIKKVHRRNRAQQRTCSLRAEEQARMQEWARSLCYSLGFKMLFVPRAWDAEKHQYKMDRIDVSAPITEMNYKTHAVVGELRTFYAKAKEHGVFPADYELYLQSDGRVAMVDFDKFAQWREDNSVEFPWGLQIPAEQIKETLTMLLG